MIERCEARDRSTTQSRWGTDNPPFSSAARRLAIGGGLASALLLGGCGSLGDLWSGTGSRGADTASRTVSDPPADEARICQLARQEVRSALGVTELRGESCSASHARPGEWQARVEFISGTERQAYQLVLRPRRQPPQGWGVVDITPVSAVG